MTAVKGSLSAFDLREMLAYDQNTGALTWKINRPRVRIGQVAGYVTLDGYVRISLTVRLSKETHFAHRLAWLHTYGEWPQEQIDHIDGNRRNNSIHNLRLASHSENARNSRRRSDNTSGYKGVIFLKTRRRWQAVISVDGKKRFIGTFHTPEEAHRAYVAAANNHHGQFARVA